MLRATVKQVPIVSRRRGGLRCVHTIPLGSRDFRTAIRFLGEFSKNLSPAHRFWLCAFGFGIGVDWLHLDYNLRENEIKLFYDLEEKRLAHLRQEAVAYSGRVLILHAAPKVTFCGDEECKRHAAAVEEVACRPKDGYKFICDAHAEATRPE
ncbi:MAG: hypothetical protein MHM6MM_004239 [Cercozoa sp. M6MM]